MNIFVKRSNKLRSPRTGPKINPVIVPPTLPPLATVFYAHLDYISKISSAQVMSNTLRIPIMQKAPEPSQGQIQELVHCNGDAVERTRTSTVLLPHGPEPCASANSATTACNISGTRWQSYHGAPARVKLFANIFQSHGCDACQPLCMFHSLLCNPPVGGASLRTSTKRDGLWLPTKWRERELRL